MGLDDVSSDDTKTNSNSGSGGSTSRSTNATPTDNSPSEAKQSFCDLPGVNPRAIKYQIKSYGCKWINQFSTRRVDEGELVMYASPFEKVQTSKTVIVFTTITSVTDPEPRDEPIDIWVTCWDLEEREAIGDGIVVDFDETWREDLKDAVFDEMKRRREMVHEP